jgi:hypothetical protein
VIWSGAICLLATSLITIFVPPFPATRAAAANDGNARVSWLALFRLRAFVCTMVIAALVHGSHAMYDSFAMIRWTEGRDYRRTGVLPEDIDRALGSSPETQLSGSFSLSLHG